MTKALLCGECMDIRGLEPAGEWTTCRCGNSSARWLDPQRGTVRCKAKDRSVLRIIGLNNAFLIPGFRMTDHDCSQATPEHWRELHARATKAPGYIFDEAKRACWACIVRVGETSDIAWEPEQEATP